MYYSETLQLCFELRGYWRMLIDTIGKLGLLYSVMLPIKRSDPGTDNGKNSRSRVTEVAGNALRGTGPRHSLGQKPGSGHTTFTPEVWRVRPTEFGFVMPPPFTLNLDKLEYRSRKQREN